MKNQPVAATLLALPLAIAMSFASPAHGASASKSYVVSAPAGWGAVQDAAVAKAGGTVVFKHGVSGVAIVESASSNFLSDIRGNGLNGALDEVVQWQVPTESVELQSDAATSGNETFVNLQWSLPAVKAQQAWDASGFTGSGVRVAIIDGGVHSRHIDIAPNLDVARSASFVPGFAFNQDVGTFWHGTHVAGIVAAADNGIGTIGIAPGATLISVKALHNGSGSFGQIISAILYAADPINEGGAGADIINMSLGALFPRGGGNTGAGQLVATMARAVNYATARNVLVVSSAGNSGIDLDHSGNLITVPAQAGSGIAISATGPLGYAVGYPNGASNFSRPASYTNYGKSAVWVAGPGGDFALPGNANCSVPRVPSGALVAPCWVLDQVLSTSRGASASISSYSFAAGTSMAAPAVSAVAALIRQRHPGISVGALKTKLAQSAEGSGPYYGKGFVNALKAVTE